MFVVYKHTCRVNGKFYIGFTPNKETDCTDPDELMEIRWQAHLYAARKGSRYRFHTAIRKYGEYSFDHEVMTIASSRDEVVALEKHWIAELDAMNCGYNMTPGGDGVLDLTPEAREKQKQATKDAMARPDVREKLLSAAKTNRHKKSVSVKRSWTDPEIRRRHTEGMVNSEACARLRHPIEQVDSTGTVIAVFPSIRNACKALGIPRSTLQAHLRGRLRSAGGFLWRRAN